MASIAHVTLGLDVGGQEKLLVEFARHADRDRFALHFVCLEERGPLTHDIEAAGWPVTALDVPPGLWPGLVFRLARLFRRGQVDVVHTHNERPLNWPTLQQSIRSTIRNLSRHSIALVARCGGL